MTNLEKFFFERYGAYTLPLSHQGIVPGAIIETKWTRDFPVFGSLSPTFFQMNGMGSEYTDMTPEDLASSLINANIVQEQITETSKIRGEISIPGLGVKFGQDTDLNWRISVTDIRVKVLNSSSNAIKCVEKLLRLKTTAPFTWDRINDDMFIVETFHVLKYQARLTTKGEASARVEFQSKGGEFIGGFNAEWENDNLVTISGSEGVPFAFRGIKI